MNLKQANRLVKLACFVLELPESKWNYSKIMTFDGKVCAYGCCKSVFSKRFRVVLPSAFTTETLDMRFITIQMEFKKSNGNWEYNFAEKEAAKFFGLTKNEFDDMFLGYNLYRTYEVYKVEDVKKNKVAKKIFDKVKSAGYKIVEY